METALTLAVLKVCAALLFAPLAAVTLLLIARARAHR